MTRYRLSFQSAVGILLCSLHAASAAPLDRHFKNGEACYARAYSAKHLRDHPLQRVTRMALSVKPASYEGAQPGSYSFNISVNFTDASATFWNTGECYADGKTLRCGIECDGGWFSLKDRDAKSILLKNPKGFALSECGAETFRILEPEPDDKIFRLDRASLSNCALPKPAANVASVPSSSSAPAGSDKTVTPTAAQVSALEGYDLYGILGRPAEMPAGDAGLDALMGNTVDN